MDENLQHHHTTIPITITITITHRYELYTTPSRIPPDAREDKFSDNVSASDDPPDDPSDDPSDDHSPRLPCSIANAWLYVLGPFNSRDNGGRMRTITLMQSEEGSAADAVAAEAAMGTACVLRT